MRSIVRRTIGKPLALLAARCRATDQRSVKTKNVRARKRGRLGSFRSLLKPVEVDLARRWRNFEHLEPRWVLSTTTSPGFTLLPSPEGPQQSAEFGGAVAVSADYRVVGSPRADIDAVLDDGLVSVYDNNDGLLFTIPNPFPLAGDQFGYSLALEGSTLVVGAPRDNPAGIGNSGAVFVFDLSSPTPAAPTLTILNPEPASGDEFGHSVSISGNTIAASAYLDDEGANDTGSAYVFDLNSATPQTPVHTLRNPAAAMGDRFGWSIAHDGDTVIVGAFLNDTGAIDAGIVYAYDLASATPELPSLTIPNPIASPSDQFGGDVSVSGTLVAVGARVDDVGATNSGTVYIFDLADNNPTTPIHSIFNPAPGVGDQFGHAIDLEGQNLLVGAWLDSPFGGGSGSAFFFDLASGTPTDPVHQFVDQNMSTNGTFGYAVDLEGDAAVIGARLYNFSLGGAFVYDLNGGTPEVAISSLDNTAPASKDGFGGAVAAAGNWLVAGVPLDDEMASNAGSAVVYDISSGTPALHTTLFHPQPEPSDVFGVSVAVDADRIAVGAFRDDTLAFDSGAVFVYDFAGPTPDVPIFEIYNPTPNAGDLFGHAIALSGDLLAVSAVLDDAAGNDSGSVYVFDLSSASPGVPIATMQAPAGGTADIFGWTLDISGAHVIVGAPNEDTDGTDAGRAYVYDLNSATPNAPWLTLGAINPIAGQLHGYSVAVDDGLAVVGALFGDIGLGSAYVYDLNSVTPDTPLHSLQRAQPLANDLFGDSVQIEDSVVVVGSSYDDRFGENTGAAFVYDLNAPVPTLPFAELQSEQPAGGDEFGGVVALSQTYALVGAEYDDTVNLDQGAAFGFNITNSAPSIGAQVFAVDESDDGSAPFATVEAADSESGVTYEISNGAGGPISIDQQTGELISNGALDFEFMSTFALDITVTDIRGATNTATITVDVNDINEAPLAQDDDLVTDEDTPLHDLVFGLLDNDSDPDFDDTPGTSVTVTDFDATSVLGATVVVQPDGMYTYDPSGLPAIQALDQGDVVTDSFTYTLTDSGGLMSTAIVTIDIQGLNDVPTATDDAAATDEDTVLNGALLGNDDDVDENDVAGTTVQVTAFDATSVLGATVQVAADGTYTYDPTAASGIQELDATDPADDTFTYTITDSQGATSTATVTIALTGVNDAPVAEDDFVLADEDTTLNGDLVSNDRDPDEDDIPGTTVTVVGFDAVSTLGATVVVSTDGSFSYDPSTIVDVQALDAGDSLLDSFTYTISDAVGTSSTATVEVTLSGLNDDPVAADDSSATDEDTPLSGSSLLNNDDDVDEDDAIGTSVTITAFDAISALGATVVVNPDGTYSYDPTSADGVQSLDAGDSGDDTFTYTITDSQGATSTATVTIGLTGINDDPLAVDDTIASDEDTLISANVFDNDEDADEDDVLGSAVTVTAFDATSMLGITINVNPDGSYTYDPTSWPAIQALDAGDTVNDSFTYTITDSQGVISTATVTITLAGVNDDPLAADNANTTDEDTLVSGASVLDNDADVDEDDVLGTTVTVTAFDSTSVLGATVFVNPDGTYTYDPTLAPGAQALDAGDTADDTFTYTITDSQGGIGTATVTVSLTGINDGPLAVDDALAGDEDTLLNANVFTNDEDADEDDVLGSTVTVTAFDATSALGVTINVNPDGSYTYDPTGVAAIQALDAGDIIDDTFTYTITDSQGAISTATVTVTLTGINDDPLAVDETNSTDEDTLVSGPSLLDNDADVDEDDVLGTTVTVTGFDATSVLGATVVVNPDGTYTYDPIGVAAIQALDAGDTVDDTFTYTITDSQGAVSTATVTIGLTGINDDPLAVDDALIGDEDTLINANVFDNDEDVDEDDVLGSTVTVTSFDATSALGVTINVNPDGTYTYDPTGVAAIQALDASDVVDDTFTYTITDSQGAISTATVTVTLSGINDDPLAVDETNSTDEDTLVSSASVLDNDADVDEDDVLGTTVTVTAFDSTSVLGATVVVNPDGTYTYDPTLAPGAQALDAGDTADDTFTYTITDSQGAVSTATVTIGLTGINDDPLAVDDALIGDEDTLINANVFDNDTDADEDDVLGSTVTVTSFDATSALGVTINVNPDGSYTYDPTGVAAIQALDAGDIIDDTFTYTITDPQGAISTATVTVTLTGINDDPLATDDTNTTDEDTLVSGASVLDNDADVDEDDVLGTTVTVTAFDSTSVLGATVVVNPDGTYTYDPTLAPGAQALDAGDTADDTFTYTITDTQGAVSTATVTISLTGINDDPLAVDDTIVSDEDTPLNANVFDNDEDADEDDVLGPTVTVTAFDATSALGVTINVNPDGTYTYDPTGVAAIQALDASDVVDDTFTYTITDSQGAISTATVTITLSGINDDPLAVDDTNTTDEGTLVSGASVLDNDADVDEDDVLGTTVTVTGFDATSVLGATVVVNPDGTYTYDPIGVAAIQALDAGDTVDDTFTYTITDSQGATSTATVTIGLTGINDDPLAVDDALIGDEDTLINANVFDNDTDADEDDVLGSTVTVTAFDATSALGVAINVNPDGSYTYDPTGVAAIQALDAGDVVDDTFTYTITDSQGAISTATVTVTLTGINDDPLAVDETNSTDEDTLVSGASVLDNDADVDEDDVLGTTVTVTGFDATSVLGATVVVNPDGTYTYDPIGVAAIQALDAGDTVDDTFTYTITDSQGATSTATVTVGLTGINDDPLAVDDALIGDEDTLINANVFDNDEDADEDDVLGSTVTVTAFDATSALGVTINVNPDGSFTYDPTGVAAIQALDAGDVVDDTFTYTITDSQGAISTATVTVTLTGINDDPLAGDDTNTTDEDTLVSGASVLDNDADVDEDDVLGTTVTVTGFDATSVLGATVVVNPGGTYTYDPIGVAAIQALDAGDTVDDTFTYTITDSQGAVSTATVTIGLTGINDDPLAVDDALIGDEDTLINANVFDNDEDVDEDDVLGSTVTVTSFDATSALGVAINVNPDGSYTYDPTGVAAIQALDSGDVVDDTFTYTITDSQGAISTATVTVTLSGINDDPLAVDDTNSTDEDTFVLGASVLDNDVDVDEGDVLGTTVTVTAFDATSALGATIVVNPDGTYTYDPIGVAAIQALDAGDTVDDTFTYTITDSQGAVSTATVTIGLTGINDDPLAVDDALIGDEDTLINANVFDNDEDADEDDVLGSTVTVTSFDATSALGVTINVNPDGSYTYDPSGVATIQALDAGDVVDDTFTYTITDSQGAISAATVTITLTGINDDPLAVDDANTTDEDTLVSGPSLLDNDDDVDEDDLLGTTVTVTAFDATSALGATIVVNPDGTYTYDPIGVAAIQALDAGDTVDDTFTYTITDSQGAVSTATVTIGLTGINDDPLAVDDTIVSDEDTPLNANVFDNDEDADEDDVLGSTVTVTAFDATSALGVAISVNPDGTYTYDPTGVAAIQALDAGDVVDDTFTYTITDSQGATSTATVTVTLTGINDDPLAGDETNSTDEDTLVSGPSVLDNDADVDEDDVLGTTVTVTVFDATSVLGATVVVNPDGTYTYDPIGVAAIQALDAGDTVDDTFTYTITDSQGAVSTATVTIGLTGINDDPLAVDDALIGDEDTPINANVFDNDEDADEDDVLGSTVTVTAFDTTSTLGVAINVNPDGSYTYDPTGVAAIQALDAGDVVDDTFTYTIADSQGAISTATVTFTLSGINDDPLAVDDTNTTDEDTLVSGPSLLDNDADVDEDDVLGTTVTVTAFDATSALGATIVVNPDGTYTYDPIGVAAIQALDVGDTVDDTFTYTITDSQGAVSTATVTIGLTGINDDPLAVDDTIVSDEDTPLNANVFDNDEDADEDDVLGSTVTVTAFDATSALGVAISVNPDGTYTYDPTGVAAIQALDAGDVVDDTFTYTITDSQGATSTATVTVTLTGINDDPLAGDETNSTDEDTLVSGPSVLDNDADVDEDDVLGTTVTVTAFDATSTLGATIVVNPDGTYTYDPIGVAAIQALDAGDTVDDTFTYTITDSQGATSTATVTISLSGINDDPLAVDDALIGDEDTLINANVFDNDEDADEDDILGATVTVTAFDTTSALGVTINVNPDGSYTYDPIGVAAIQALDAGDVVDDTFTYTITDSQGATSTATVTIGLTGINDDPLAVDDTNSTDEDTLVSGASVLDNDADVDEDDVLGTTVTVTGFDATSVLGATVVVNPDGTYTYDPIGVAAIQALDAGDTVDDTFTYTITDTQGATSTATVTISLSGINDDPLAVDDALIGDEDTLINANVFDNDEDADEDDVLGTTVTVTSFDATSALGVTINVNPDGTYTYDPTGVAAIQALDAGDVVDDTFTYTIADSQGAISTATVTFTLSGINDDPLAVDDTNTTDEDTLVSGPSLLDNDADVDEDDVLGTTVTVTAFDATSALGATIVVNPDGTYTYDPIGVAAIQALDVGDTVDDTFTYTITDTQGATGTATVTISLSGINDDPLAVDDALIGDEDTLINANVFDNDEDADEDDVLGTTVAVTAFDATSALGVTINVNPDGSYTYDPTGVAAIQTLDAGDVVDDTFTYTIADSQGAISTATVTFTLSGINDDPLAVDDTNTTDEDTLVSGPSLLDNDADVDEDDVLGTTVTVTAFDATSALGATIVVNPDGTYTYDPIGAAAIQALDAGDTVDDTFTYTITDSQGATSTATVTIGLTGINDDPLAVDDALIGDEDTLINANVFDNDTDADDDDVLGATVTVTAFDTTSALGVTINVNPDGSYTYDPIGVAAIQALDAGDVVDDTFTYTITDSQGATSTATVTIGFTGINDDPLAVDDALIGDEDTLINANVLDNDEDADEDDVLGSTVTVTAFDAISALGVAINVNPDGGYAYDPSGVAVIQALDAGDTVDDTFTYTITDSQGAIGTATVTITLSGVNDDPLAVDDSATTSEDDLLIVDALSNDLDVDEDDILGTTVAITGFDLTSALGAIIALDVDGNLVYDPTDVPQIQALRWGKQLTDTFTYTITDSQGATSTATVTITVEGRKDSPSSYGGMNNDVEVPTDGPLTGPILDAHNVDLALAAEDEDDGRWHAADLN